MDSEENPVNCVQLCTVRLIDECTQVTSTRKSDITLPVSHVNAKSLRSSMTKGSRKMHHSSQKKQNKQPNGSKVTVSNKPCSSGIIGANSNSLNNKRRMSKRQQKNSEIQLAYLTSWKESQNYNRKDNLPPSHSQFSTRILKPNDYLFFSIFTTIFCFFPLGKYFLIFFQSIFSFKNNPKI
jgi:hypothetical protein